MKPYSALAETIEDFDAPIAARLSSDEVARLVENYLPLVAKQVDRVWLSSRIGLTREDLLSAGSYGLLMAARRFDPNRGVGFGVFARSHVHGAVMREINLALRAVGRLGDEVLTPPTVDIESDALPDTEGANRIDPAEAAEVREMMEYTLSSGERLALTLYYFEELTVAEIAAVLEQSASSVARTIKGALGKLRSAISEREVK
ncbi:MAG TPA: sigma-70 family RNA polymerase sigma factor [Candidatus Binataceae bacterium]|nr:sigma-70 family RNA polymerase sigma factor [Candidatus Binataceae bacterium]